MKSGLIILFATLLISISLLSAQLLDADIVQVKLNRLYFSEGIEAGVNTGTPFYIDCDGDSVLYGVVEYAGAGISYSQPSSDIDTNLIKPDCLARLTISTIDSTAEIKLGTDLPLELFDPVHETLFLRTADSAIPLLADSSLVSGKELFIYLNPNIMFSDGLRVNAAAIIWWLKDLQYRSRSYPVRYFMAKMLPIDKGGAVMMDAFTVRLTFHQNFPMIEYLLSHPDFKVYNPNQNGTGALVEIGYSVPGESIRAFIPNRYYRGDKPAYSKITIKQFRQSYRMKFEFENGQIHGYYGFGFDEDLAGRFNTRTQYPYIAALISNLNRPSFANGRFSASIYYRFNLDRSHLIYPHGKIGEVFRWTVRSDSVSKRYYPFDFLKGKSLHKTIGNSFSRIKLLYDNPLLYETGQYIADIVAREGCRTILERYAMGREFDLRLAFLPASDKIIPFSLISTVLEINDQNAKLSASDKLKQPGWDNLGRGSSFREMENRMRFFNRAANEIFDEGSFFPLFRPWVYGIGGKQIKGQAFDFYGYPQLSAIALFKNLTGGKR
ncbi:MAG: hypothetical protein KAR42_01050 [candidate division Zixibacteria bacterium]|nr:hypothetical protein [candidate division Zixibacteria bacterium]